MSHSQSVYMRTLARAAEVIGGFEALAAYLDVRPIYLHAWMNGTLETPPDVFLQVVDLLMYEQSGDRGALLRLEGAARGVLTLQHASRAAHLERYVERELQRGDNAHDSFDLHARDGSASRRQAGSHGVHGRVTPQHDRGIVFERSSRQVVAAPGGPHANDEVVR